MLQIRTIQSKLFYSYSAFIISVVIVIVTAFYLYISNFMQQKASEALFQLSRHVSTEFDTQFADMNATSVKILFSEPLHDLFFSDMFQITRDSVFKQRQFTNILYPMIGYDRTFKRINMFRMSGEFASVGDDSRFTRLTLDRISRVPWVKDTLKLDGAKFITPPHPDSWTNGSDMIISLSRAFPTSWGGEVASILEVQQDYGVFVNIIDNAQTNPSLQPNRDVQVYVVNRAGETIYPLASDTNLETTHSFWQEVATQRVSQPSGTIIHAKEHPKSIIAYSDSDTSGWTVIAVQSKSKLLAPVVSFRNIVLMLGLLTMLITLIISYWVARSLTIPIKRVHKSIKLLSLNTLPPKTEQPATMQLNELEQLNNAFHHMRLRLQESLEETIAARAHELEAHNFALQSQMNPHFLYNTITNISIMAEEQNQQSIVDSCESLTHMLRYIASSHAAPVLLQEELEHTSNYLSLMKLRYEDKLQFKVDISPALLKQEIPKLTIQPLVENALKYGIHTDPPWQIEITGTLSEDQWELMIRDSGHGFEEDQLRKLEEQLNSTDPHIKVPSLRISGMGLLNIYSRMKLHFGEQFLMQFENAPAGGAIVRLIVKRHNKGVV